MQKKKKNTSPMFRYIAKIVLILKISFYEELFENKTIVEFEYRSTSTYIIMISNLSDS